MEIVGARVLDADGVSERPVAIADGLIVDGPLKADRHWDAGGCLLLPGIVDIHGDAFERQLMPRPGVQFSHNLALIETDRQLVANGITTAYHGLTLSWEPGLRSIEAARDFRKALAEMRPRLAADTRLHLRFEIYCLEAVDEVERWIEECAIDVLAFNDHMEHIVVQVDDPRKLSTYSGRTGLAPAQFIELMNNVLARKGEVPAAVERLAAAARKNGLSMLSHDDETPEMRKRYADLGCAISEFPLDRATAKAARDAGSPVVLGAPNVLRGGSHAGRLTAAESVREGLCTVLSSDYYYPAPLHAAFRLVADGVTSLPEAWKLVSANAAAAVGLADRGKIEPGRRADLIIVDDRDPAYPRVVATFVAGKVAYAATDDLRRVA